MEVNKMDMLETIKIIVQIIAYSAMGLYWIRRNLNDKSNK
jgi:hypothetical protein